MTEIIDDVDRHRLVVTAESGDEAELVYRRDPEHLYLVHTGVPEAFRGQGTGGQLVSAALELARREGLTVVPWCPFARRWMREHPAALADVTIDWKTPPPDAQPG